jgi:hypothetical protein
MTRWVVAAALALACWSRPGVTAVRASGVAAAPVARTPVAGTVANTRLVGGPGRVALIELFTSEGCSSCPPAEQWLSGLRAQAGLWRDYVPISYHVDYWDRLGWRDRFATRAFTERQYAQANAWGSGSVYTPCFVRDGEEWRPRGGSMAADGDPAGTLVVDAGGDGVCRVEFAPAGRRSRGRYEVHLAVADPSGQSYLAQVRQPVAGARASAGTVRLALAAWVTRPGEFAVIQAAGGWLTP